MIKNLFGCKPSKWEEVGFPDYLGFGKANKTSLTDSEEKATVDYVFNDQPVHRVEYFKQKGYTILKDVFAEGMRMSGGKDLKLATLMHFNNMDLSKSEIFQHVRNETCNLGNVYFENPSSVQKKSISYFPAGKIMLVRVIVTPGNEFSKKLDLLQELKGAPVKSPIDVYNTVVIELQKTGLVYIKYRLVFEFLVPVAEVYSMVKWLAEKDLIGNEQEYSVVIQDSVAKNADLAQMFEKCINNDSYSYQVHWKGLDSKVVDFEELINKLVDEILEKTFYNPAGTLIDKKSYKWAAHLVCSLEGCSPF